jgi:hypothetical protein
MYQIDLQELMPFAAAVTNGFVLGKRTHFRGYVRSFLLESVFVFGGAAAACRA